MTDDLSSLVKSIEPASTVLFLGAGSSLPSHAPSVGKIIEHLANAFGQSTSSFTLPEIAELIEQKTKDRKRLVSTIRTLFTSVSPTGGLLSLPLYDWKAIYTTNYDELVEEAYRERDVPLTVYASNFDFGVRGKALTTKLYKLHGTISKDIVDGQNARLIISEADYQSTEDYRQYLYNALKADLSEANLLIIGHSLS